MHHDYEEDCQSYLTSHTEGMKSQQLTVIIYLFSVS